LKSKLAIGLGRIVILFEKVAVQLSFVTTVRVALYVP